jgi:hypothetical protein
MKSILSKPPRIYTKAFKEIAMNSGTDIDTVYRVFLSLKRKLIRDLKINNKASIPLIAKIKYNTWTFEPNASKPGAFGGYIGKYKYPKASFVRSFKKEATITLEKSRKFDCPEPFKKKRKQDLSMF